MKNATIEKEFPERDFFKIDDFGKMFFDFDFLNNDFF